MNYKVSTFNQHNQKISELNTESPFVALSECVLKSKKPYGTHGRNLFQGEHLFADIKSYYHMINDDIVIFIRVNIIDINKDKIIQKTILRTNMEESTNHFHPEKTVDYYKNDIYQKLLFDNAKRIISWLNMDKFNFDLIMVLVNSIMLNPNHIYWGQDEFKAKVVKREFAGLNTVI